jgi:hypothetical protein
VAFNRPINTCAAVATSGLLAHFEAGGSGGHFTPTFAWMRLSSATQVDVGIFAFDGS